MTCGSERRGGQGEGLLILLPHYPLQIVEPRAMRRCLAHKNVMALNPGNGRACSESHWQGTAEWYGGQRTNNQFSYAPRHTRDGSRRCPSLDYLRLKLFCYSHRFYMVSAENFFTGSIQLHLSSISAPFLQTIRR